MTNAWYAHYPGDYGRDTAHLSLIQHGAYRLLLDHYYATSAPLPADIAALYRICRAFDQAERDAVDHVLSRFFSLQSDGYHNARADVEIVKRNEHHERLANGARKTNVQRWGYRLATRSATRPALARPQPQSQPKRKTPAAKSMRPADLRYQQFVDFAYENFEQKHGQGPDWKGRDWKALQDLLGRNKKISLEEMKRRWKNYLASTELFIAKQGDSLGYFCTHLDSFISGPLAVSNGKGTQGRADAAGPEFHGEIPLLEAEPWAK